MLLKLIIFIFFSTTVFAQNQQPNTVVNNIYTGNGSWERNNVGIDTFNPVGIGSTNPGDSLDVQGTIRTINLTVSSINSGTQCLHASSTGIVTGTGSDCGSGGGGSGTVTSVGLASPNTTLTLSGTNPVTSSGTIDADLNLSNLNVWAATGEAGNEFELTTPYGNYSIALTALTTNTAGIGTIQPIGIRTTGLANNGGGAIISPANSIGIEAYSQYSGSGSMLASIGVYGQCQNTGSGITTNCYSIYGDAPLASSGTITNSYAGYFNGTTYINGNVGISSANPGQALDVQGTIRMSQLTASSPVISASDKSFASGSYKGNTTVFQMNNGTLTSGNLTKSDANQNIVDSGIAASSVSTATGANPSGTIGLSAVNGSSANFIRADGAPALSQAIIPTWTGLHTFQGSPISATFSGNVGVGSTLPGQMLDVQGTVRSTQMIDSGATASTPLYANASKQLTSGAFSGNTTTFATASGSLTNGHCVSIDVNGNFVDAGGACSTGGGGGTVASGTVGYEAVYTGSTTVGSGVIRDNGTNIGIGSSIPGQILDVQGTVRATNFTDSGVTSTLLKTNSSGQVIGAVSATDYAPATTGSSILKASSGGFASAVSGTDYAPATSSSASLQGNGSGGFTNVSLGATGVVGLNSSNQLVAGTGYQAAFSGQTAGQEAYWSSTSALASTTNQYYVGSNLGIGSANPGQILDVQGTIRGTTINGSGAVQYNGTPVAYSITGDSYFLNNSASTGAVTLTKATHTQNTVMGAATSTTAADLSVPSCSTASSALTWTTNTGFGCNSISGGSQTPWTSNINGAGYQLTNTGNIGIGSTAPGVQLDVQGSIRMLGASAEITVGTPGVNDTGILGQFTSSTNSYNQLNIQNTNSGATASSSYVVGNNNETATTYYGEFGMNSSGFTGSGDFNTPNMVYLDSTSADLVLGTTTSNNVHFELNNSSTDTMTMVGANVGIGSTLPGQALDVNGTIRSIIAGNTYIGGNLGIGTTAFNNALAVQGGMAVGNVATAGAIAPSNGLIVTGDVGIGTVSPSPNLLAVVGGNVGIGTASGGGLVTLGGTIAGLGSATVGPVACFGVSTNGVACLGRCTSISTDTCACTCL